MLFARPLKQSGCKIAAKCNGDGNRENEDSPMPEPDLHE